MNTPATPTTPQRKRTALLTGTIILIVALVLASVLAWLVFVKLPELSIQYITGPLPQQAYIWQRDWSTSVNQAVDQHAGSFGQLVALAAEVSWTTSKTNPTAAPTPHAVRIDMNIDALKQTENPVGLAIRVGAYRGSFNANAPDSQWLLKLAQSILHEAGDAGLHVAELQIDFDAATSQLPGYRNWVVMLRTAVAPVPLTITTLPSWMNSRSFAPLVAACDGYVLQVHSLTRPKSATEPMMLCDPVKALAWVKQAARLGRPFRVALPTYGYDLVFNTRGKYTGLLNANTQSAIPAGATIRRLEADSQAMAGLIACWLQRRPRWMTGVIWYRLPVQGERRNWSWPTLNAVMKGQPPLGQRQVILTHPQPGLVEVNLKNVGDDVWIAHQPIVLRWPTDARPMADAVGGFILGKRTDRSLVLNLRPDAPPLRLRPGQQVAAGWLRFKPNHPNVPAIPTDPAKQVHADEQPF